MLQIDIPDPNTTPFDLWASVLTEQLASYNVPNPWTEDLWAAWAVRVVEVEAVAELGVADPRTFANWRDWGLALSQAVT